MKKKIEQFTFRGDVYNAYLEISDTPSPLGILYGRIIGMELFRNNEYVLSLKNGEFDKPLKEDKRIRDVVIKIATKYNKINFTKLNITVQGFLNNKVLAKSNNPEYIKLSRYIIDKATIRNAATLLNRSEDEFMPKPMMSEKEMIIIAKDVIKDFGIIGGDDMFDKYNYVDRYAFLCDVYNKDKNVPYDCLFVSISKPRDKANHIYMVYEDDNNRIHVFYLGHSMTSLF